LFCEIIYVEVGLDDVKWHIKMLMVLGHGSDKSWAHKVGVLLSGVDFFC
jgi:hypothetical protein